MDDIKTFSFCGTVEYMAPEVSTANRQRLYSHIIMAFVLLGGE